MNAFIETLNASGATALRFATPMLWQSSLLILIVLALDIGLKRHLRAAVRHALWLVVLVKLLLPPALALPTGAAWWLFPAQPVAKAPALKHFTISHDALAALPPVNFVPAPAPLPAPPPPRLELAGGLLLAAAVVSAALLLWLLWRWLQVIRTVRRAVPTQSLAGLDADGLDAALAAARRLAGRRAPVRLKIVEGRMSPAVCGLFRPVILLPRALAERLSPAQLRTVLLHELIHLRRRDIWVNCAQALLQIAYWWHPLVWLANARIRRAREEAVDDAVMLALRAVHPEVAAEYAPTLLAVARLALQRPRLALGLVGIMESRSALRQRIERLLDFRAPRRAGLTLISGLGLLAFTAVAVPMGQGPERANPANDSAVNLSETDSNPSSGVLADSNTIHINARVVSVEGAGGVLADSNFAHALEQLKSANRLNEPEVVTSTGHGINRIPSYDLASNSNSAAPADKSLAMSFWLHQPKPEAEVKTLLQQAGVQTPPATYFYFERNGFLLVHGVKEQLFLVNRLVCGLNGVSVKEADSAFAANLPKVNDNAPSSSAELFIREFKIGTNIFVPVIEKQGWREQEETGKFLTNSQPDFGTATNHPANSQPPYRITEINPNHEVSVAMRYLFANMEIDMEHPPGKAVYYNDRAGVLLVRATGDDLDRITRIVEAISRNPPGQTIPAAQSGGNAQPDAGQLVREAQLLYESGKLEQAQARLAQALALEPDNAGALYYSNLIVQFYNQRTNKVVQATTGRARIMDLLNSIRLEQVDFEAKPLGDVVRFLLPEIKRLDPQQHGINFIIAPNPDALGMDLPSLPITLKNLTNARLADVLNAIVVAAPQPIRYSIEEYAIVFSPGKRSDPSTDMSAREYRLLPPLFFNLNLPTNAPAREVSAAAGKLFSAAGVNWDAPPGKVLVYDDRRGMLLVKATQDDLDLIGRTLAVFNTVPPGQTNPPDANSRRWVLPRSKAAPSGTNAQPEAQSSPGKSAAEMTVREFHFPQPLPRILDLPANVRDGEVESAMMKLFSTVGVNMALPRGKSTSYDYQKNMLFVCATPDDLDIIGKTLDTLVASLPDQLKQPAPSNSNVQPDVDQLLQEYHMLRNSGQLEQAQAKLTQALALDPTNGWLLYYSKIGTNKLISGISAGDRQHNMELLHSVRLERVNFKAKPLSEVVNFLDAEAKRQDPQRKGITFSFYLAPERDSTRMTRTAGPVDLAPLPITLALTNVTLDAALNAVVAAAPQPVRYNVDDIGVGFYPGEPTAMLTREYQLSPQLYRAANLPANATANNVAASMYKLLADAGVNMDVPRGKTVIFDDRRNVLLVRATPDDLGQIDRLFAEYAVELMEQVHIKARFIEIPEKAIKATGLDALSNTNFGFVVTNTVASSHPPAALRQGILDNTQFQKLLHALEKQPGVVLEAEPEVVTTTGRQTQMRATTVMNIMVITNAHPGNVGVELGPVFDVVPRVLTDGYTINLHLVPSEIEFLGYVPTTNVQVLTSQPQFNISQAEASVNVQDGQTVFMELESGHSPLDDPHHLYDNLHDTAAAGQIQIGRKAKGKSDTRTFVFVTTTIVDPAGNPVHEQH